MIPVTARVTDIEFSEPRDLVAIEEGDEYAEERYVSPNHVLAIRPSSKDGWGSEILLSGGSAASSPIRWTVKEAPEMLAERIERSLTHRAKL